MICDRYGVSSRAGAAIANAALADAGVISAADQANVIDKNKLTLFRLGGRWFFTTPTLN